MACILRTHFLGAQHMEPRRFVGRQCMESAVDELQVDPGLPHLELGDDGLAEYLGSSPYQHSVQTRTWQGGRTRGAGVF